MLSRLIMPLCGIIIKSRIALLLIFLSGSCMPLHAQRAEVREQPPAPVITGSVTDAGEHVLSEVTLLNERTGASVQTGSDGRFTLQAIKGDFITTRLEGFAGFRWMVTDTRVYSIRLNEQSLAATKSVVLPEGVQSAAKVTGAYGVLYGNELARVPVADITNALPGRLAGLYVRQTNGTPGADAASLNLHGQTPLLVIDGVPRSFTSINPNEIESITLLKDAMATNLYGMRASNGALVITTRKGVTGKQEISFTAQYGVQSPVKKPSFLNAYDYSRLYNEALQNDGLTPLYSDADLQAYKNHTDPYGHPDVDWYRQLTRNNMRMTRYSLDVSGGGQFARYFIAADRLSQQGIFITSPANAYNTNNDFSQYSVRSNVEMYLNKKLKAYLNVYGVIKNGTEPGVSDTAILRNMLRTPNNAYPAFNKDSSYGGNIARQNNLYAQTVGSGYLSGYNRTLFADLGVRQELSAIVPGLWIKGLFSINADLAEVIDRSKTFATFQMQTDAGTGNTSYQQFGTNGTQNNTGGARSQSKNVFIQGILGFDTTLGNHEWSVKAIAGNQNYLFNSNLPLIYRTYALNAAYSYAGRYQLQAGLTSSGSNEYPSGHDMGFFPAVAAAWNISAEQWARTQKVFSLLRLKASYGRTGNDDIGYYDYQKNYTATGGYTMGASPTTISGVQESRLYNTMPRWEKADKLNIGIEAALCNNHLNIQVDYYHDRYFDLMQTRGRSIEIIGYNYPQENIGRNNYYGVEANMRYQARAGRLDYFIAANISTQQSTVVYADEVNRAYNYMKRTGQKVGQQFGYIADGFYQDANDVAKYATTEGYKPVPGDIRYKDLNGDGVINQFDQTVIGSKAPLLFGGLQGGISWKGISLSFLLQGTANNSLYLSGNSAWEFLPVYNSVAVGYGQAQQLHLNRWTPQHAATATYPRLTVGGNVNNQAASSFWIRNGNYLRMKNIELSYHFPHALTRKIGANDASVFVNAYNLFTISHSLNVDPEAGAFTDFPLLKMINTGVNIAF